MSPTVVLTSTSKLLRISLDNDRCSMKCSEDCAALFVNPPDNTFVSTIDISLKDREGSEISAVSFSTGCNSGEQRIRVDGLLSLVFDHQESITVVPQWLADDYSAAKLDEFSKFEMTVSSHLLEAVPDSVVARSALVPIHSGALKVADATVPISKEILAITSPFFNAHFYGSFSVVEKNVYEIKDVDKDDFLVFINSILLRSAKFASVDQALAALAYADRFGMLNLPKCALPYLLKNSLPDDAIKDTLLLCDRFKDNEELIVWVLRQCKDAQARGDLVFECAPYMQKHTILAAHKVLKELHSRLSAVTAAYVGNLTAPICLRFYDENQVVEREIYFTRIMTKHNDLSFNYDMWDVIPEEYTVVKTGGLSIKRGESEWIEVSPRRIVEIHAYRK